MRKFILSALMLVSVGVYGQDDIPAQAKLDTRSGIELKDGVSIYKSGTRHSGKTYTEIYDAVTDSVVYRFGLEFKSDGAFVRRVPMENYDRKFYDMMQETTRQTLVEQEKRRQETIEFLNRYRTSPEVWLLLMKYKLLDK